MEGEGNGTAFTGTLPSGVDLFHVSSASGQCLRGVSFEKFKINVVGGRNWFNLDTTALGSSMAEVNISRVSTIDSMPGMHCVFLNNGPNSGGVFDADFSENVFRVNGSANGCIYLTNAGDSIRVTGGILTGVGHAVYANQMVDAGNLVISGVNMTASSGIWIDRALKPVIRDFEMELSGASYSGAAFNLNGNAGLVKGAVIGPGQITLMPGATGFGGAVYLGHTSKTEIDGVMLSSAVGGYGVYNSAGSDAACFGNGNSFDGFSTTIINSGTNTKFVT